MLLSILLAFIAISLPYCLCHCCRAVIVIFVSYWHGGIETYRAQTMYIVMIAPYQILHHFRYHYCYRIQSNENCEKWLVTRERVCIARLIYKLYGLFM